MRKSTKTILSVISFLFLLVTGINDASAQGIPASITVLAVKTALESAIQQLNSVVSTAGAEIRGSGNSLQANAQNVLDDVDRRFSGRLNDTLDKLNQSERQTIADAYALSQQVSAAANTITNNVGDQAVRVVQQADVTAYNTMYDVPCRNQIPRILSTSPHSIRIGDQPNEVDLVGNYLAFGPDPNVIIDGVHAQVIGRTAGTIRVALPPSVLASKVQPGSIRIAVSGITEKVQWTPVCIFGAHDIPDRSNTEIGLLVIPPMALSINGNITGSFQDYDTSTVTFHHADTDGDCGANRDSTSNYCLTPPATIQSIVGLKNTSANCSSSISSPSASGDHCVVIPARVAGCGYDNFYLGKNCKGRGWVNYDVDVVAKTPKQTAYAPLPVMASVADGTQYSFTFSSPQAGTHSVEKWTYNVNLTLSYPNRKVETISISDANPAAGPVSSHMVNGTLGIMLDRTQILIRGND